MEIRPQLSKLNNVSATIPTVKGTVKIQASPRRLDFTLPAGTSAKIYLPKPNTNYKVKVNGKVVSTKEQNGFIALQDLLTQSGSITIE